MPSPTEITVSRLARLVGTHDCPILIDVRIDEDYDDDPRLVPGSYRYSFEQIMDLVPELTGKRVVIICQKGKKISQGVGALLRDANIKTETLEGGQFGWRDAGLPMVPGNSLKGLSSGTSSLWVTRHRPKIDRIACPWLIRRFVDPRAKFLFVSPVEVLGVAEKFDAIPFDVEDVAWSHRGETCTFDTMVEGFGLDFEPLKHLARIVRGADTDRHDLEPQAAGLLAISLGLSRMYRDDHEQLNQGMVIYDALYRWARDATSEGHDWPALRGK